MLSADDMRIFLEVARHGRLTEAATRLKLDHTTVGRHISRLERATEQRLFVRAPSGWVLTAAGLRLLVHAETVDAAMLAATEDCLQQGSRLTGSVRAIAPDGFGSYLLVPGLGRMAAEYPALTLEVVTANRHTSLTTREFDIAVTIERPEARAVSVRKLADYELRFYASPSYLAGRSVSTSVETLVHDHEFIWYVDDALGATTQQTLYEVVPAASPRVRTNSMTGQIAAGVAGLGLVFLPSYIGDAVDGLERLPGPQVSVPHSYWLLTPHNLDRLAKVTALTRLIESLVDETPGLRR